MSRAITDLPKTANFILLGTAHAVFVCEGFRPRNVNDPPLQTLVGDPSPRQTSIGKNSDCVIKSEQGALVRGSVGSQSSHEGRCYVTGACQASEKKNIWPLVNRKQRRLKFSVPLRWQKSDIFSSLGKERRTSRATSRPTDHGSTCYFDCRHLY